MPGQTEKKIIKQKKTQNDALHKGTHPYCIWSS